MGGATVYVLGGNPAAAQPPATVAATPAAMPVSAPNDEPCACEERAACAYRRYMIIQVLTILFYLLMVAVLLKFLLFR
jgi:hypothetical protein